MTPETSATDAEVIEQVRLLDADATEGPWEATNGQVCNWRMVVAQFVAKSSEDASFCAAPTRVTDTQKAGLSAHKKAAKHR